MIDNPELAVVNAASRALKIHKKAPNLPVEDIIKKIMPFLAADEMTEKAKIAAIAAVNGVIKLRRQDKTLAERQIIEKFVKENRGLINELKEEEI